MLVVALGMLVFNLFQINWENPLAGNSLVASIGVLASGCAFLLLLVLQRSLLIAHKLKGK